ncbi:6,7-dimethyl-8-ribityllumazine synthase [Candidatus Gracilibacteria bacterium]|nr:6,7-dimethyl-8-ribityllumazine synthase [Candidatus Gracilibacteria bacterium]
MLPNNQKIAIINTKWNTEFVDPATESCIQRLKELGVGEQNIDTFRAPGGVEIPLLAKKLAESGKYAAIIGVAFICENPIYHYHFVAASVVENIIKVGIDTGTPVLCVSLSPVKFDRESSKDIEFYSEHMKTKGVEAAESCVEIIELHNSL